MGAKHLAEQTRKAIIQMRTDGHTPKKISEVLGVNACTVSKIYNRYQQSLVTLTVQPQRQDEPEPPGIDWQAKWCEAQQQIAELKEINAILKGYVRHLQRLNEQQDRM